jgi:hypothetical protein
MAGSEKSSVNVSAKNNSKNSEASLDPNKETGIGSQAAYCSQGKSATTIRKGVYATGGLEFYGCK